MRSIPPRDYETLPRLAAPAGYMLVARDIDSDTVCINRTQQPCAFVENLYAERGGDFGIELVSIVECADLAASEAELYQAHRAILSADWLELDAYQIEGLRRSALQIDAHASHYLFPQGSQKPEAQARQDPASRNEGLAGSTSDDLPTQLVQRGSKASTPVYRRYGQRSLRRRRQAARASEDFEAEQMSIRQILGERFEDWLVNHPGTVIAGLIFIIALLLLVLSSSDVPMHYSRGW